MGRKVILSKKDGTKIYPKTFLDMVYNTAGTTLTSLLNAINTAIAGKLGKTEKAVSATTADTATKLATARTLSYTGGATGSGSFDGSANVSIPLTVLGAQVTGIVPKATADADGNNIIETYAKKTDIANAYTVQGSVQNTTELHALATNVKKGDVYNIITAGALGGVDFPAGSNVVYIGSTTPTDASNDANWDLLGGTYDLSAYATKDELIDLTYTDLGEIAD